MIPGELFIKDGDIELNAGRKTATITVANSGDRPIQVGSHYHFFETNPALKFERKKARGMRLDIAAGTAVRFEPGQTRDVQLVALAGKRAVQSREHPVEGVRELRFDDAWQDCVHTYAEFAVFERKAAAHADHRGFQRRIEREHFIRMERCD